MFEPYRDLHAQGLSQRRAAQILEVPRSTLQAWRAYHARLDECPAVVAFFHSPPGLALLPRLVLGLPLVSVEVGACGMRLACLCLKLTGLQRFVGASYGTQPQVNRRVADALGASRHQASTRLAHERPAQAITITQEETCTGGLCLVGIAPKSHDIVLEQLATARAQDPWKALREPALAGLNCQGMQSTSDAAPGLLASVAHPLGAPHAPDFFHGQQELSTAVSAPLAAKERAAHQALETAQETLEQVQERLDHPNGAPEKWGPGRPPTVAVSLEQAEQAVETARQEPQRLFEQREQSTPRIRALGNADHCVDWDRGVRRNGRLIARALQEHLDTIRTVAHQEGLSQSALDRIEQAERVVPKMQATMAFVSGDVRPQVRPLALMPPPSYAMHAPLMPSDSLDRVASSRTVTQGAPLCERAERMRTPLFEPDGVLGELSPEEQNQRQAEAVKLAEVFQRSRATVEGRNGSLSLRHHQLRGLDRPRKRAC